MKILFIRSKPTAEISALTPCHWLPVNDKAVLRFLNIGENSRMEVAFSLEQLYAARKHPKSKKWDRINSRIIFKFYRELINKKTKQTTEVCKRYCYRGFNNVIIKEENEDVFKSWINDLKLKSRRVIKKFSVNNEWCENSSNRTTNHLTNYRRAHTHAQTRVSHLLVCASRVAHWLSIVLALLQ